MPASTTQVSRVKAAGSSELSQASLVTLQMGYLRVEGSGLLLGQPFSWGPWD